MSQEFDPLEFFSGEPHHEEDNNNTIDQETENLVSANDLQIDIKSEVNGIIDEETTYDIHVLDLPILNKSLPDFVLLTLLQLLALEEILNFGNNNDLTELSLNETLEKKGISHEQFNISKKWLEDNGYLKLSRSLLKIKFNESFFKYLNKIFTSPFISNTEIIDLTSLRISENCGRTAQPNFKRKIVMKNFDKSIVLNEPALTSDSLGLKTWGSALILSEILIEGHKSLLKSPILELGSGTGLTGITISLLGYDIILTDLKEIVPNLKINVDLNKCNAKVDVLDWTDASSFINKNSHPAEFKTLVIADPIYSPDHPKYVVNMIKTFLMKDSESRVLLQIPIRPKFENERNTLWELLKSSGFKELYTKYLDGFDDFGSQKFIFKELRWDL